MCFFLNVRGAQSRGTVVDWSSPDVGWQSWFMLIGFRRLPHFGPGVPRICPGDCLLVISSAKLLVYSIAKLPERPEPETLKPD